MHKLYTIETSIKEPTFLDNSLLKALIVCLYNPYIRDGGSASLIKTCKKCTFIAGAFSEWGTWMGECLESNSVQLRKTFEDVNNCYDYFDESCPMSNCNQNTYLIARTRSWKAESTLIRCFALASRYGIYVTELSNN